MKLTRLERNLDSLQALAKANRVIKRSMISHASKDLVLTLVECARNIIKGNVRVYPNQLRQLEPYEQMLREFTKTRTSQKQRKNILQQGGFLGALLKPILGLLFK